MLADPANLAVLGRASMELPPKKNETMNELSRWDPFRELEDMQHRLSSVLGRQTQRRHDGGRESITVAEWAPLVDISEDDKEYLIKAELPEVKKEEIKVTVENGVLVLYGARKLEKEEKDRKYHRIERAYGASVAVLPCRTMPTLRSVNAEFNDGMLKLHIARDLARKAALGTFPTVEERVVGLYHEDAIWYEKPPLMNERPCDNEENGTRAWVLPPQFPKNYWPD